MIAIAAAMTMIVTDAAMMIASKLNVPLAMKQFASVLTKATITAKLIAPAAVQSSNSKSKRKKKSKNNLQINRS